MTIRSEIRLLLVFEHHGNLNFFSHLIYTILAIALSLALISITFSLRRRSRIILWSFSIGCNVRQCFILILTRICPTNYVSLVVWFNELLTPFNTQCNIITIILIIVDKIGRLNIGSNSVSACCLRITFCNHLIIHLLIGSSIGVRTCLLSCFHTKDGSFTGWGAEGLHVVIDCRIVNSCCILTRCQIDNSSFFRLYYFLHLILM